MYKRGAVVLVPFPFSDLSENKVRPVVVVSKGVLADDVVVVAVSSAKTRSKSDVLVDASKQNGLKVDSVVRCSKIVTLDAKIIIGEIGTLTKQDVERVLRAIRTLFA